MPDATVTLTFPKAATPSTYAVHRDGRPTGLEISKDTFTRRRWGGDDEWDVMHGDDVLFTCNGLSIAKRRLQTLAELLTGVTA